MADTKIEWAEKVWNPIAGCTKCSPGCLNCYAERMAKRLAGMEEKARRTPKYGAVVDNKGWMGNVICDKSVLDQPLHWRKPKRIFVCSMSDLFHEKVPFEFIDKLLYVMYRNLQHTFLILTKRPERMLEYFVDGELLRLRLLRLFSNYTPEARLCREWPLDNVHLGVSISTYLEMWKADVLEVIPAAVRFISLEPLLEDVPIDVKGLDWVVVGCESGPKRRKCHIDWITGIVNQCKYAGVPVFIKQININGKVVKMPKEFPQELPERK